MRSPASPSSSSLATYIIHPRLHKTQIVHVYRNILNTQSPIISCINIDTVVAPCCFTKLNPKPTEEEASVLTNIFVLFNIKYCDRSGWHSTTKADGINTIAGGRIKLLDDDLITYMVRACNNDNTKQHEDDDDDDDEEEDTGNEQDDD
jgi:hypothetical protein